MWKELLQAFSKLSICATQISTPVLDFVQLRAARTLRHCRMKSFIGFIVGKGCRFNDAVSNVEFDVFIMSEPQLGPDW